MANDFIYDYLIKNMHRIYQNFEEIFHMNFEEFATILKTIIVDSSKDEFYTKLVSEKTIIYNFEKYALQKIQNMFQKLGFLDTDIKKIILTIPEIILFATRLEDIYLIYKNETLKGLAFLDKEEYRAYSYSVGSYKSQSLNGIIEYGNVNDYKYVVEELLNSLEREDIKNSIEYQINQETNLKTKFQALTRNYSRKNYYFKKK